MKLFLNISVFKSLTLLHMFTVGPLQTEINNCVWMVGRNSSCKVKFYSSVPFEFMRIDLNGELRIF